MQLREHQLQAKKNIYKAWENGAKNVLIVMPTGGGKTVLFSNIIAEFKTPAIVVVHRTRLVNQISLTLAKYNVRHNIIAQKAAIKNIVNDHMNYFKKSFYDPQARCVVASVDTLIKLCPIKNNWFKKIGLIVQDEGHHALRNNKWGKAAALFPNARGLYPTATPTRADGKGLGRKADGLIDYLIESKSMRELIDEGFLTDYRIIAAKTQVDLSDVPLSAGGDFSPQKLATAVHKSKIVGDVVTHYLKFAAGKLGVTFAVDIKSAKEIAENFKQWDIPAEIITSKTPEILRNNIMRRFERREILQLINVDLLGEGVDVPAIEVISMARPTNSFVVYAQQFGRALRPALNKKHAIIIDHVGNYLRHNLPDKFREWTLERQEKKPRGTLVTSVPLKNCLNEKCLAVYERIYNSCPECGLKPEILQRSSPEFVDGDLVELDQDVLKKLRGEIERIDNTARVPQHLSEIAQRAIVKHHFVRQQTQAELRRLISVFAGFERNINYHTDSQIYRKFYLMFNVDVLTAQTLNRREAVALTEQIVKYLKGNNIETEKPAIADVQNNAM